MGEGRSSCRWGEIYSKTTSLVFVCHSLKVKYFIFLFFKVIYRSWHFCGVPSKYSLPYFVAGWLSELGVGFHNYTVLIKQINMWQVTGIVPRLFVTTKGSS